MFWSERSWRRSGRGTFGGLLSVLGGLRKASGFLRGMKKKRKKKKDSDDDGHDAATTTTTVTAVITE